MSAYPNAADQPDWSTANGPYGNELFNLQQFGPGTVVSPKVYIGQGQSMVLHIVAGGIGNVAGSVTVTYYDNTGLSALFTQPVSTFIAATDYVIAVPAWSAVVDVSLTVNAGDPAQFAEVLGSIGTVIAPDIIRTKSGVIIAPTMALGAGAGQNFTGVGPSPGPATLAVDTDATKWKVYGFVPGAPNQLIFAAGSQAGPSQLTVPILLPPQQFTLVGTNLDAVARTITAGIFG